MHHRFAPFERCGSGVVDLDVGVDRVAHAPRTRETGVPQRRTGQEAEPDFNLVQPACVRRRVVKMHIRMARHPVVVLRLVRVQVIEDDMELDVGGVVRNHLVHEIEKLAAAAAPVMPGFHLAGGDIERGKERRRPVSRILVIVARHGPPIRQAQVALGPFQCLDVGLFVNRQDDRVLRGMEIQADDVRGLGHKLRVRAHAPAAPSTNCARCA